MCFYNDMFLSILTAFPPLTKHAIFIWSVKRKSTTVYKKISLGEGAQNAFFLFL